MKKFKFTLLSLVMMAVLVACGGGKEQVAVCEGDIMGLEGATGMVEYSAKGDLVYAYKTVQNIPYKAIGASDKESFEAAMEEGIAALDLTDNIEYSFEYKDDMVVSTIHILDISKATQAELEFAGLSMTPGSRISLEMTVENQESISNMSCTVSDAQ